METVFLWGYNYQYPIAEIHGSSYSQVKQTIGISPESISSEYIPEKEIIDNLRNASTGLVTTYTWRPLYGMESQTKPNGDIITYLYDSFGRLVKIFNQDGKTLQQNIYHYK